MPEVMQIEVVYALPEKQVLIACEVPVGTSLAEAIELSGIRDRFDQIEVNPERLGIFSVKAKMEDVLRPGDRVEIYRPLIADPKEARRARAQSDKKA
jgi:putative ubiquitin-RnfH superfamily antitoxin RatB of RatAB toxin-antitoxin module